MAACAVAFRAPVGGTGRSAAARLQQSARPFHRPALSVRSAAARPQAAWLLATGLFALKLLASVLAGAAITMVLWPDSRKPVVHGVVRIEQLGFEPGRQESRVYRSLPG